MEFSFLKILFEDVLYNSDSIFEPKMINQLFNQLDRGFKTEEKLFGLVQLELWRSHYSISF